MLNVGVRIKIRKDLKEAYSHSSSFGINDEMEALRGMTAVITRVREIKGERDPIRRYGYSLDIDNGLWQWGIDMFDFSGYKKIEIE